jgi:hypothetical protein
MMTDRWWIQVCPECNGLLESAVQAHNETCPNRWRLFVPGSIEVMPVSEAMNAVVGPAREVERAAARGEVLRSLSLGRLLERLLERLRHWWWRRQGWRMFWSGFFLQLPDWDREYEKTQEVSR